MARQPVQARARAKYDAIFKAAAELFDEQGFAKTTVDQILERAGSLSRGSLYNLWRDKDELAYSVVQESLIMDSITLGTPRLQSVVDASILLAVLTPHVTVIRAANRLATEQGKPFFGYLWRTYTPVIAELMKDARDLGELQPGLEPADWAALWVDAWVGLDLRFRENYGELAVAVDRLNQQMVHAVATAETAAKLQVSVGRGHELVHTSQHADAYYTSVQGQLKEKRGSADTPAATD
ncbi:MULTISPECIES: TetR/AcrR family transcriptional regulator [Streptomyces]|uniref:TetR/AcrR family transcriptional regulator n=1 Tax=Streptomyces doebereineriae TaxID=3075528 RepID=A0ABU2VI51_9ACTN|nr:MULTISPECIES: TetR/AcrR family transcriptional regulator [Streptomyces]MCX5256773.1 TetR/AcrR family transcriptional regulator [Streptomyces canus]MDT0485269.1 TetR/AcrR family transcriptional regulator [Streptomyces sp. DSM 41640]